MTATVVKSAINIKQCLLDTLLAGLCALVVFGPIVGVVLRGYSYNLAPGRVAVLVAAVMAGRFILSLVMQSACGRMFARRFESADDGVYVRPVDYRSPLRWAIPLLMGVALLFPFIATKYLLTVAILGLIYVLLGLGLNIVVGLAGLLDLGMWRFTPSALTDWRWVISIWGLGSGFMLPLGRYLPRWQARCSGFRCCVCTVIIWRLLPWDSGRLSGWCSITG
ncbi:leucine/isoleucine/valine transporter permease subunit [Atlantibacter hermannii]|nr:leucine/isoleucine/valine transporter permease subunit [Atlantibacter hermannii]